MKAHLKYKKVHGAAPDLKVATSGSQGLDLYISHSYNKGHDINILKNETMLVPTGIALNIPEGFYGEIVGRSSNNKRGVLVPTGVIDNDYTGELLVCIHNTQEIAVTLKHDHAIAQLLIKPCPKIVTEQQYHPEFVRDTQYKERGAKGFGSSNKISFLESLKNAVEGSDEETG